ncbi:MAG: hypothetical protein OHK0015_40170 [Chloroflexi bacterium OHK40]
MVTAGARQPAKAAPRFCVLALTAMTVAEPGADDKREMPHTCLFFPGIAVSFPRTREPSAPPVQEGLPPRKWGAISVPECRSRARGNPAPLPVRREQNPRAIVRCAAS